MDNNSNKKLSKKEIIKEISSHTNIKEQIVKSVYEGFVDVALAEIANKGTFEIHELFKVSATEVNSNLAESGKTYRLTSRISAKLRRLFKLIKRGEVPKVDAHNVKERLRDFDKYTKNKQPKELSLSDLLFTKEEY